MKEKHESYEKNFKILEQVADSLNRDEIGIDDLIIKTREALEAARNCINILNFQKGEFKKLENEFGALLRDSTEKETAEAKSSSGDDIPQE